MATWQFYVVLDKAEITDADCDSIYAAGCDDGTIVSRDGVTYIAFDREGDSPKEAADSAVAALMNAGWPVTRAEVDEIEGSEASRRVIWTLEDLVQEELKDYFRHFVALSGCYHAIDSNGRPTGHSGVFHYSGFVVETNDEWYWVTAGHVFEEEDTGISTLLRKHRIEIDRCVLDDSFAGSPPFKEPIPFSFEDSQAICCCDKRLGVDIAALRLRQHEKRLLAANDVVPVSQKHWEYGDISRFDGFLLLGLPQELEETEIIPTRNGYHVRTKPAPVVVHINRTKDVPQDCAKPTPRFAGIVHGDAGDITGMSGGPIFGVRIDDPNTYLVALQSSWLREQRLIFGCPISVVIEKLSAMCS